MAWVISKQIVQRSGYYDLKPADRGDCEMKGLELWASLRMLHELWLNHTTPPGSQKDGLGRPSYCGRSRQEELLRGGCVEKTTSCRGGSERAKSQRGSCSLRPFLSVHPRPPTVPSVLVPWPGVKGQPPPCYPAPSTAKAQPPPCSQRTPSATSQQPLVHIINWKADGFADLLNAVTQFWKWETDNPKECHTLLCENFRHYTKIWGQFRKCAETQLCCQSLILKSQWERFNTCTN